MRILSAGLLAIIYAVTPYQALGTEWMAQGRMLS